ncbi:MAG: metallophosphoesterase [Candidatus Fermentithermobacillus carboniphilus]|uniref:Phosphoesterase n=1 Tax=Candidatus Fermentithermobacillus carboniphilus TaxID=3085328 RepID=A0AAT9LFV3_9FIRM|nr:MAG: metallophosphoesterase [Candidatus Fermentithermobacillus carboniphilus]
MLIGVLSDTHGDLKKLEQCLGLMKNAEYILHAGDFYEDAQKIARAMSLKVIAVTGNCDYMVRGPSEEMLALGGQQVYLTHGHLYRVKQDLSLLVERSRALGADVTVFGHTHCPLILRRDGILFLNPGSPHSPRHGHEPSCALLELTRTGSRAKIILLP